MKIQHFYVGWRFKKTLWYSVHSNVLIVSKIIPLSGTISNSPTHTAPNVRLFPLSTPYSFLPHKLSGPMWDVMLKLLSVALDSRIEAVFSVTHDLSHLSAKAFSVAHQYFSSKWKGKGWEICS